MPTISGSKLFAIGRILLQEEPASFPLISPIWECRTEEAAADDIPPEVPEEYRWRYQVNIPRPDAEHIRYLLWKAADRKEGLALAFPMSRALKVTVELAELWDALFSEL
jgi:hypothetical protein